MLMTMVGLLMLGTGCPHTYRKGGKLDRAMQKDMEERFDERDAEFERVRSEEDEDDEEERVCPADKVESWDCSSQPCKVMCK
ncbi:hypothetical protein [Vitiosangium sp. GDMCC 1.1324]|uniref:hypothetical protein n=1 Tax=Vitiosangium sp. (strain GDMCC 1.1324) TaxID=2138576 RepID=UPI000D4E71B6|nr:hypothetical protein [Vitiosangium sp. GDMCC 1.1324]PTL77077.1 hypothetical protein DAT35_46390 [Vitiosangium sp. GDMCC 1.1324]